jgi:DNA-binding HxlR family transcriptional regulator
MLGRTYDRENCSAARALEIIGERWSLLIIRNAMFAGSTRFTEFQRLLGVAPNILSSRLDSFVEAGLMETTSDNEYVLTSRGLDLQPVIIALTEWGDRWAAPQGPPMIYEHEDCGGRIHQHLTCDKCDAPPVPGQVTAQPGPGFNR